MVEAAAAAAMAVGFREGENQRESKNLFGGGLVERSELKWESIKKDF